MNTKKREKWAIPPMSVSANSTRRVVLNSYIATSDQKEPARLYRSLTARHQKWHTGV
jgi:hypothetical protein